MAWTLGSARCSCRGWLRSDDHLTHQEAADRFVIITLVGVSFVGARYARLDRLFYDSAYTVTAHFAQSGGIFAGAEVTYRGVGIGRV